MRILLALCMISAWLYGGEDVGSYTLQFDPDLTFGGEDADDHYLWTHPETSLAVDRRGHIFVADIGEKRILHFDDRGNFLDVFARHGQGPGELGSLDSFHILSDGRAIAHEAISHAVPKLHFFNGSLVYQNSAAPEGDIRYTWGLKPSPGGNIMAATSITFNMETETQLVRVVVFDEQFKILQTLSAKNQAMPIHGPVNPAIVREFLIASLKATEQPGGLFNFGPQGRLYSAQTTQYEINVWDKSAAKVERVIKRKYKPIPNTEASIRARLEGLAARYRSNQRMNQIMTPNFLAKIADETELSPAQIPLFGLLITEDHHLLAIHDQEANGRQMGELFSPEGLYLGRVTMADWSFITPKGIPRMLFRNGFAYTVSTDIDGDSQVTRYRYKLEKI